MSAFVALAMPPGPDQVCNRKKKYGSKIMAKMVLRKRKMTDGHAYECKVCNSWHLTSMSVEVWRNRRDRERECTPESTQVAK